MGSVAQTAPLQYWGMCFILAVSSLVAGKDFVFSLFPLIFPEKADFEVLLTAKHKAGQLRRINTIISYKKLVKST